MKVKIRLQQHGCKNHPLWWIVAMGAKKNKKGRYIEKLGEWRPRQCKTYDRSYILNIHRMNYWIGNGAEFSDRVRVILEEYGMLPVKPPCYGTAHTYDRKKNYAPLPEKKKDETRDPKYYIKGMIEDELSALQRKKELVSEALQSDASFRSPVELSALNTTDIESDEADIFERKRNFDEISRRFNAHKDHAFHNTNTNDYRYMEYVRKMNKLAWNKMGGIDLEGYRNRLNNLSEISKLGDNLREEVDYELLDEKFAAPEANEYTKGWGQLSYEGGRVAQVDLEEVTSDMNEDEKLNVMKQNVIKILEQELLSLREYEKKHVFDDELKAAVNPLHPDHEEARTKIEDQKIRKEAESILEMNKLTIKSEGRKIKNKTKNDFLDNYSIEEEAVTQAISNFLIQRPDLLEKVRYLQKDNMLLNPREELDEKDLMEIEQVKMKESDWYKRAAQDPEFVDMMKNEAKPAFEKLKTLNQSPVTREDIERVFKRIGDAYRAHMNEIGETIDLTSELEGPSAVFRRFGVLSDNKYPNMRDIAQQKTNQRKQQIKEAKAFGEEVPEMPEEHNYKNFAAMTAYKNSLEETEGFDFEEPEVEDYEDDEIIEEQMEEDNQDALDDENLDEEKAAKMNIDTSDFDPENNELLEDADPSKVKKTKKKDEEKAPLTPKEKAFQKEVDAAYDSFVEKKLKYSGRYLPGYRHYESFEHYRLKVPDASIKDYHREMNREISKPEFIEIFKQSVRLYLEIDPIFARQMFRDTGANPHLVESIMNTPEFEQKISEEFYRQQNMFRDRGEYYRFVYAIEDYSSLNSHGPYHQPPYLSYTPSRKPAVPQPKFDEIDVHQPLNIGRSSPFHQLNPNKVGSYHNMNDRKDNMQLPHKFQHPFSKKTRRLSGWGTRKFFSTQVQKNEDALQQFERFEI